MQDKILVNNITDALSNEDENVKDKDFISQEDGRKMMLEIKNSLTSIAASYGLNLAQIQSSKNPFEISMNLSIGPVESINMDIHARNYLSCGARLGLLPEWFNRTIESKIDGQTVYLRITGLASINNRLKVICATGSGDKCIEPSKIVRIMSPQNRRSQLTEMGLQILGAEEEKKSLVNKLFRRTSNAQLHNGKPEGIVNLSQ